MEKTHIFYFIYTNKKEKIMSNDLLSLIEEDAFREKEFLLNHRVEKKFSDLYTLLILSLKNISKKKVKKEVIDAQIYNFFTIWQEMAILDVTLSQIVNYEIKLLLDKYIQYIKENELYELAYNYLYFINGLTRILKQFNNYGNETE